MHSTQPASQELEFHPLSGWLMLFPNLAALPGSIFMMVAGGTRLEETNGDQGLLLLLGGIALLITTVLFFCGYFTVAPNQSRVLLLFGVYKGTVRKNGFCWTNPFMTKKKISLRARNLNGQTLKVNDKIGNPIEIAAVVVWRVHNTAQAAFDVDDYEHFVTTQSEAAVRQLAGAYPYDSHAEGAEDEEVSLRDGRDQINGALEKQLGERLAQAGVEIMEARIAHLAYAPEIAGAMLQRQQASAVVAARSKIVDGAVGMVEMALEKLSKHDVVHLDEERKAAMVSNLMVVLCGDKAAQPVVNSGSLYT